MRTSHSDKLLVGLVAVGSGTFQLVGSHSLPVVGVALVPAVGLAVAAGLRLGDRGAVAAAVGVAAGGLLVGTGAAVHLVSATAVLAYALVVSRCWPTVRRLAGGTLPGVDSRATVPAFVATVAVGSLPAAALAGSASTLLIGTPFFVVVPDVLVRFTASGVLVGGPLTVGLAVLQTRLGATTVGRRQSPDEAWTRRLLLGSIVWLVVGSGIDLAGTLARIVPPNYYESQFGLAVSPGLFTVLQVGAQVLLLGVVLAVYWRVGLDSDAATAETGAPSPPVRTDRDASTVEGGGVTAAAEGAEPTRLTRRDALLALGALGFAEAGAAFHRSDAGDGPLTDSERERLRSLTDVLYPSAVSVDAEFLQTYVLGRYREQPDDREGAREALAVLEDAARERFGTGFASLSVENRERVLEAIGVRRVGPVPDGRRPERVRYYLVNDLLYALYSTPVGGRLLGKENPTGHPGGLDAYQRGPDA